MSRTIATRSLAAAGALMLALGACTTKKQEAPPLTGPSEFGTSITVQITPDVISQDGASQALVTITARDANGLPARNVTLRVETLLDGVRQDVGTLSARTVVTGSDGRATVTFTAPNGGTNGTERVVEIAVTPVGSDFNNAATRTATVRLTPPGVVFPPANLNPQFTVSPASPTEDQSALFDASTSTATAGISSFTWSFGDGTSGSGQTTSKTFADPGNFTVALTITDVFGRSATTTRLVSVQQGTAPTPSFVFSPTDPRINQAVNFNASASTAAAGRRIVLYRWDFGDQNSEETSSPTASHSYASPRTYTVTLTVVDDTGRTGTTSQEVTVAAAGQ